LGFRKVATEVPVATANITVMSARARSSLFACSLLALLAAAPLLFCAPLGIPGSRTPTSSALRSQRGGKVIREAAPDNFLDLSAVEPAVSAYAGIWTPLFQVARESGLAPEALLHWGHAAAMATVLLAMGGYGAFLGWQTRFGNGGAVYPLSLGMTAAELHPTLMAAALFFFFLGGQGGLVLLAVAGQPLLQSAHSSTAVIGLSLMAAQAVLGTTMGDSAEKRTIHAYLGTGVLLILLVHMYFGLNLGFSF